MVGETNPARSSKRFGPKPECMRAGGKTLRNITVKDNYRGPRYNDIVVVLGPGAMLVQLPCTFLCTNKNRATLPGRFL